MDVETTRRATLILALWGLVLVADTFWRTRGKLQSQEVRYRK